MPYDPTSLSKLSVGWDSDETLGDASPADAGSAVFSVGYPGADIVEISTSTHEVNFGSISGNETSVVTVGVSGAGRGDTLMLNLDSEFSGAGASGEYNVVYRAHSGDTAGEVNVVASNNSTGAIDPISGVMRITRIGFADYI